MWKVFQAVGIAWAKARKGRQTMELSRNREEVSMTAVQREGVRVGRDGSDNTEIVQAISSTGQANRRYQWFKLCTKHGEIGDQHWEVVHVDNQHLSPSHCVIFTDRAQSQRWRVAKNRAGPRKNCLQPNFIYKQHWFSMHFYIWYLFKNLLCIFVSQAGIITFIKGTISHTH